MGLAARLFNGNAEHTLYEKLTPSEERREFLQNEWNTLRDKVIPELEDRHGYSITTWLQGSYKFGTLIPPVHKDEEYDVDVGVYFQWASGEAHAPTPTNLREWMQDELRKFAEAEEKVRAVLEPPKERCSRVHYQKQFHIDTPVYHLDPEQDTRRLALLSGAWEASDPKALYLWFKNLVDPDARDQLRRLVRYCKGWAAVTFPHDAGARPSSVLLTVLAAEAFLSEGLHRTTMQDDDALRVVVASVMSRLQKDRRVPNPVERHEDLNRIPMRNWDKFMGKLEVLYEAGEEAAAASDEVGAALSWTKAFLFLMPLPEASEVEVVDDVSGRALMVMPRIRVTVFSKGRQQVIETRMDDLPRVARDRELEFEIVNPEVVPACATVEWTVRNNDAAAGSIGDIGHQKSDIRLLSVTERTEYPGRHFMDCVVRNNGQVLAVRRVPVTVIDLPAPARSPPRPAYTRLKSRRGR